MLQQRNGPPDPLNVIYRTGTRPRGGDVSLARCRLEFSGGETRRRPSQPSPPPSLSDRRRCSCRAGKCRAGDTVGLAGVSRDTRGTSAHVTGAPAAHLLPPCRSIPARRTDPSPGAAGRGHPLLGGGGGLGSRFFLVRQAPLLIAFSRELRNRGSFLLFFCALFLYQRVPSARRDRN